MHVDIAEPAFSTIGYCIGGLLAVMYAALHPDGPLKNLACIAAPIDRPKRGEADVAGAGEMARHAVGVIREMSFPWLRGMANRPPLGFQRCIKYLAIALESRPRSADPPIRERNGAR